MIDTTNILCLSFFLPFLYAETHYRFKYFFSWLRKPEPEIIADIPSRITRGELLPLLIIVKDADKYPVEILTISVADQSNIIFSKEINQYVLESYFEKILFLSSENFLTGHHKLNFEIRYKINDRIKLCNNDNHRGTSHMPLPVYISSSPLPQLENCVYGEPHSHTNYTTDQVEFGASINSTSILAKAMGLKFFCATDHSYDLDNDGDNYLKNDPDLNKWKKFQSEVKNFNKVHNDFCIIPGEEASLNNFRNKNIHCLIYNSKKFYPGAGDSGEKWLHPYSELSIQDILDDVNDKILVFAAHPVEPVPFLQRLLIRRDNWHEEDCKHTRLNGLQFANGGPERYLHQGKQLWIKMLMQGRKLVGLAGNDAHGNFSRYRQVSFPFVTMKEKYYNLFGVWRTGVYLDSENMNIESIMQSLSTGNCFLTNGPALQIRAFSEDKWQYMGSDCRKIEKFGITLNSSDEFGYLDKVTVFMGIIGESEEKVIYQKKIGNDLIDYNIENQFNGLSGSGYLRVETSTKLNKMAISNPIWFKY